MPEEKNEKEQISALRKRINRKTKIAGVILATSLLLFGLYVGTDGGTKISNFPLAQNQRDKGNMPYMEDNQASENKEEMPQEEDIEKATLAENPDTIEIEGRNYFLFDGDILLPLNNETWEQYDIPRAESGSYEGISEFYVKGESPSGWTQKFTIHRIKNAGNNCYEFADKLVNGIIATVKDDMTVNDQVFSPDNIAINYVRKNNENTLFFWEKKDIPDIADETQFVRIFISRYSHQMYLATYTLKTDISRDEIEEVTKYMKTLNSVQELKKEDPAQAKAPTKEVKNHD